MAKQDEVRAKLSDVRLSAQKARLVADQIRGLAVDKAFEVLDFSTKKAAPILKKLLASAVANAEHNQGLDIDDLAIVRIFVDDAASLKRFRARAKGRGNRIIKRNCHITLVVAA